MLVLSRCVEERILIGDSIEVLICRIGNKTVRVGIKAPRDMRIVRKELIDGSKMHSAEAPIEAACGTKT